MKAFGTWVFEGNLKMLKLFNGLAYLFSYQTWMALTIKTIGYGDLTTRMVSPKNLSVTLHLKKGCSPWSIWKGSYPKKIKVFLWELNHGSFKWLILSKENLHDSDRLPIGMSFAIKMVNLTRISFSSIWWIIL